MENAFEVIRWSNDRTIVHVEMLIDLSDLNIEQSVINKVVFNFKFYDKSNKLIAGKEDILYNIPTDREIVKEIQLLRVPLEAESMTTTLVQLK